MHLLFFIRSTDKKAFSVKIKNLLSQNDCRITEEPSFTEFKNSTLDVKWRGGFSEKNCLLSKTMSSEVKLIVQNDVRVEENGNFTLIFASDYLEGKRELFLSQNDQFFTNSFRVNMDTNDVNHTSYDQTPSENQIDLTTGELKYVNENIQKSKEILDRQTN